MRFRTGSGLSCPAWPRLQGQRRTDAREVAARQQGFPAGVGIVSLVEPGDPKAGDEEQVPLAGRAPVQPVQVQDLQLPTCSLPPGTTALRWWQWSGPGPGVRPIGPGGRWWPNRSRMRPDWSPRGSTSSARRKPSPLSLSQPSQTRGAASMCRLMSTRVSVRVPGGLAGVAEDRFSVPWRPNAMLLLKYGWST